LRSLVTHKNGYGSNGSNEQQTVIDNELGDAVPHNDLNLGQDGKEGRYAAGMANRAKLMNFRFFTPAFCLSAVATKIRPEAYNVIAIGEIGGNCNAGFVILFLRADYQLIPLIFR
jgi:hypothetical protein